MFEEDFERCFMCQQPCKGLYCSSECRLQDKGTPSPAFKPSGPVRLTAPIPASLSPLTRPSPYSRLQGTSPLPPRSNSSSSSDASSPLQSPSTNPSGLDSPHPRKESFNLPPPAYNLPHSLGFAGSIPVKIPPLALQPSPAPTPQALPPHAGTSIETLRFGRKSGTVNSVTSPNALLPRCACGKPFGHRQDRSASTELDSGFNHLSLGPALNDASYIAPTSRQNRAQSGHTTPQPHISGSLLSRSRSDPIPPFPKTSRHPSNPVSPSSSQREGTIRRASHLNSERPPVFDTSSPQAPYSPLRGRSRERQRKEMVETTAEMNPRVLNHPPEREHPPSRSRARQGENRRSTEEKETQRERDRLTASNLDHVPQILPSWSRRHHEEPSPGEGLVPRRPDTGSPRKSPSSPTGDGDKSSDEERKRAEERLGLVYGLAAGKHFDRH